MKRPQAKERPALLANEEPGGSPAIFDFMTKESLQQQADRAEALAAQTADDQLRDVLLEAARQYREQLKTEESKPRPEA
jgi:hypothetical protein